MEAVQGNMLLLSGVDLVDGTVSISWLYWKLIIDGFICFFSVCCVFYYKFIIDGFICFFPVWCIFYYNSININSASCMNFVNSQYWTSNHIYHTVTVLKEQSYLTGWWYSCMLLRNIIYLFCCNCFSWIIHPCWLFCF